MRRSFSAGLVLFAASITWAQNAPAPNAPGDTNGFRQAVEPQSPPAQTNGLKQRPEGQPGPGDYQIASGTHVLLTMINSVSTKQAYVGERIYLETAFPVMVQGRIVVPQGSWVTGTVTHVKKPGRVKGRGELQVRFDSLSLPNGVTRNFNSDLGAMDPRENETLKNEGGKITGPGDKKGDTGTVIGTTTAGTVIGSGIGAAAGNVARGAGVGAGAGAAAGLLGVLMTRGPDATLSKGSTVEMVLDRPITFHASDLDFTNAPPRGAAMDGGAPPQNRSSRPRLPLP